MTLADSLLDKARQMAQGRASQNVAITRGTLKSFVEEIDDLRSATSQIQPPNKNQTGKHHKKPKPTERAAALAVQPRSGTQRMKVLRAIANSPDGLTDPEVSDKTGIYLYSAAPRRCELVEGGWVMDSGITRATEHGKEATVWIVTAKARAALRNQTN